MQPAVWAVAVVLTLVFRPPMALTGGTHSSAVVWLFLVDDLHIDFRATGVMRAWLLSLSKALIRDDDAFAARATGPSPLSVGLLAGLAHFEHGIRQFHGSAVKLQDAQSPESVDEVAYRAKVAMTTAMELMSIAPQHDPRRKVMLYIGKGFDEANTITEATNRFLAGAWRLDVTVIALDAAAVPGAQKVAPSQAGAGRVRGRNATRQSLEQLALPTHGFVLDDEVSLGEAAVRISNAIR